MSFPITFRCKSAKKDKTEVPMYFEVRPEKKNRSLPLGRRIPTKYLTDTKTINTTIRGAKRYAEFVSKEQARLEALWENLRKEGYPVTFELLKEYFTTGKEVRPMAEEQIEERTKGTFFAAFARQAINAEVARHANGSDGGIQPKTAKLYFTEIDRIEGFHPNLTFEKITPDFVRTYYDFCKREGGFKSKKPDVRLPMKSGSMQRVEKFLRKYLQLAEDQQVIAKTPMKAVSKLHIRFGVREYLNIEEIKQLSDLYYSRALLKANSSRQVGQHLQTTLWYMLAGCYLGLRYSDWREFDPNEHLREGKLIKWLVKGGKKKQVIIPIRKPMQALLDDVWQPGEPWVMKVPNNSTYNYRIRKVLRGVGIEKHISSHCLRHTFAITSLLLGIRIEVISDLLGHSNLQTTQIYARIVNEIRESQMDVWNDFFKDNDELIQVYCERCATKLFEYPVGLFLTPMLALTCAGCGAVHQHTTAGGKQAAVSVIKEASQQAA